MRWFVRGDVDGFFGLAVDNIVQVLLIHQLLTGLLGFPESFLLDRILPGVAVSLLIGNLYYGWQAMRLGRRTGREDVCALPYGINTVSLIAFVFLVMLPEKNAALEAGLGDEEACLRAWRAGLLACAGSGLIELVGAFFAERIRRSSPRAALLATLAGIALGFISLGFLFRAYAYPIVGLSTFAILMLTYFGKVRFRGRVPGGLVAVGLGTALCWMLGIAGQGTPTAAGWHPPLLALTDLFHFSSSGSIWSVILPMGLFNVIGSLQNIESAEAAGDSYSSTSSLAVNGVGTLAAAAFGSCFPTTIYIGHPGWKAMGARAGYSVLNGVVFTLICCLGLLGRIAWAVPIEAGMAIVLWIGVVISAQAFTATPRHHAAAVVVGLLPGIAAWGAVMAKTGLRAAGLGSPGAPMGVGLEAAFEANGQWIQGAFALEQGCILSAMILAGATVCVIERRFFRAAAWCGAAAVLSALGLLHSYRWTQGDTVLSLRPAWGFVLGYGSMALVFLLARWITAPPDQGAPGEAPAEDAGN